MYDVCTSRKKQVYFCYTRSVCSGHISKIMLQRFALRAKLTYPEVFLGKGVLKICSKFTGEHPCGSAFSINLLCNFIEITLQHGCSPVNLLHIFRTAFLKNSAG